MGTGDRVSDISQQYRTEKWRDTQRISAVF
jgi:hypothetical protein